jgi:hypothetical protein
MMSNTLRRSLTNQRATQRLYHHAAPLFKDGKTAIDRPNDEDDSPPIQTFNKSPIVQKLWKTRDWAKRRVMGELTMGDDEYSSVSLAATEILAENATEASGCSVATGGKTPQESHVGIEYPFSTDQYLLETYRNPWGEMRL